MLMSGCYEQATICENGHIISEYSNNAESTDKYCSKCGGLAIKTCKKCGTYIRGQYNSDEFVIIPNGSIVVPAYCHNCGDPYPWTSKFLNAADEMVDMFDDLTPEQKQTLKSTFPDLIVESPNSQLAALRASKLINGLQEFGKDIFINLLSENIIPTLFTLMHLK